MPPPISKHRPPRLPGVGLKETRDLSFRAATKTQSADVISFSDKSSLDVTLGYDNTIASMATSSLESNYFWARNALTTSTCPLDETMV